MIQLHCVSDTLIISYDVILKHRRIKILNKKLQLPKVVGNIDNHICALSEHTVIIKRSHCCMSILFVENLSGLGVKKVAMVSKIITP